MTPGTNDRCYFLLLKAKHCAELEKLGINGVVEGDMLLVDSSAKPQTGDFVLFENSKGEDEFAVFLGEGDAQFKRAYTDGQPPGGITPDGVVVRVERALRGVGAQ